MKNCHSYGSNTTMKCEGLFNYLQTIQRRHFKQVCTERSWWILNGGLASADLAMDLESLWERGEWAAD